MKYLGIFVVVAAALVIAWFILNPNNTSDYVVMVTDDIEALEEELIATEAALEAGTLTPTEATAARTRIIERISAIETSAVASGRAELTVGQRQQLSEGLERLKNILLTYSATLIEVDTTAAVDSNASPDRRSGSSSNRSLAAVMADTINSFERTVEDVVEEYAPDMNLTEAVDDIVAEAEMIYEEATETTADDMIMEDSTDPTDATSSEPDTTSDDETDGATSSNDDVTVDVAASSSIELDTTETTQ